MGKQIMYDDVARRKAVAGVEKLAKAVKVTLGPAGKNVIIEKAFGGTAGHQVTVSPSPRKSNSRTPSRTWAQSSCSEVASKTNDVAGDGTTTAHRAGRVASSRTASAS